MAKFKFSVSTGFVGSAREEIYEIDDDDFVGLSDEAAEALIDEHYDEWMHEKIYCSWKKIGD